jgi:hypothetical protein
MLSNDLKQILMLHPVRINYNLSKDKKPLSDGVTSVLTDITGNNAWEQQIRSENIWDGIPFTIKRIYKNKFRRNLVESYIKFLLFLKSKPKEPVETFLKIRAALTTLKINLKEEEIIKKLLNDLETSMQVKARKGLLDDKEIIEIENKLASTEFNRYQTEESLINFIKSSKRGLCLVEIDNFDKIIPNGVCQKINKADKLKIFDNFYILYYDKEKIKNVYYTEKPKPKDPIVFGVVVGCTKLFFIADWIDEYCNLTYSDVIKNGTDFKLK